MDRKPPCKRRVILTRSEEDIERDRDIFERYGFSVVAFPLIKIEPLEFEPPPEDPNIIIFQSAKAVKFFLSRASVPEGSRVIAVGEKTRKALEEKGVRVDLVPREHSAAGLLKELPEGRGELVLIPRSEQGREELLKGLPKKGYRVFPLNVYRTSIVLHPEEKTMKALGEGGFLVLASPSAVRSLFANLQRNFTANLLKSLVLVSIGKTTKMELEKFGFVPNIVPVRPLMEEVAGKIHEFWQENC